MAGADQKLADEADEADDADDADDLQTTCRPDQTDNVIS